MTNSQNPLGVTLSPEKKQQLVELLQEHNVVLIEDDVYSELYYGRERPLPARAYDQQGITLHCSSFSKCLVAGFRIGWVAAGKHARRIQQLQLMSTLSTSSPMQLALVDYLATKRYDTYLRKLRRTLAERKQQTWQALHQHFPSEVKVHRSESGYFLWVELPEGIDASLLSEHAIAHKISIAPGKMFTTGRAWDNYFRLNASWALGERERQAVVTLASLIQQQLKE
jgi:DNA-binding transcriptional MocR family regulator